MRSLGLLASAVALACGGCSSSPIRCVKSVSAYCADANNPCQGRTNLAEAVALCDAAPSPATTWYLDEKSCPGQVILTQIFVDAGVTYFYESRTGALIAVLGYHGDDYAECWAGPSTFAPHCSSSFTWENQRMCGARDAGAD